MEQGQPILALLLVQVLGRQNFTTIHNSQVNGLVDLNPVHVSKYTPEDMLILRSLQMTRGWRK